MVHSQKQLHSSKISSENENCTVVAGLLSLMPPTPTASHCYNKCASMYLSYIYWWCRRPLGYVLHFIINLTTESGIILTFFIFITHRTWQMKTGSFWRQASVIYECIRVHVCDTHWGGSGPVVSVRKWWRRGPMFETRQRWFFKCRRVEQSPRCHPDTLPSA